MTEILVGTCGYQYFDPGDGWKDEYESKLAAYADTFRLGELNRTFYRLPQVETANRWRREAADDFEFTVKAWQAITHPWGSPTWNSYRETVEDLDTDDLGYFQPTDAVQYAWEKTRARVNALESQVVLFQTPPSFECTQEHEANMREFFTEIERGDLTLAWEPRGDWDEHPDRIAELCDDLDLVHVVDLLRKTPVTDGDVLYTRLHGLNDQPYDYDYDYDTAELEKLADQLESNTDSYDRIYCLFNNFEMYDNATELGTILTT